MVSVHHFENPRQQMTARRVLTGWVRNFRAGSIEECADALNRSGCAIEVLR
jgi:hypothetical protein